MENVTNQIDLNDPNAYYVVFFNHGVSNQVVCRGRSIEEVKKAEVMARSVNGPYLKDEKYLEYVKLKHEVQQRRFI